MPRERRNANRFRASTDSDQDSTGGEFRSPNNQPESPSASKKKRRGSTASNPTQASPSLPDLVPPPPLTGFGETIVASNPFDDTPPANPALHQKPITVTSGRIYPPDQPMVFNPQNPNAPPIYPCGICHKEVHDNDQAILCESGCNFWFHRVCTGLTEAAYHLLTAEVYAEWVCDKCLSAKNIPLVKFKP